MTTKQANRLMAEVIKQKEEIDFTELSDRVQSELGIQESSANAYIHSSNETDVLRREGRKVVSQPTESTPTSPSDSTMETGETAVGMDAGGSTEEKYGSLTILEDVGHPAVPEGHDDYIRRRMGEKGTGLGTKTDVEIVTSTMNNKDFGTLLVGKHGVGKDKLILHICEKTNRPMLRLVGNDDPDFVNTLVGSYAPNEDGEFEHRKGLLTMAIEHGYVFMIDEFNALSGKVQTMLNMILEDSNQSQLVIPETNEVVEPHPEFRFVATQNPNEVGYGGREMLDHATASRFFQIDLPPLPHKGEKRVVASQTKWDSDNDDLNMLLRPDGGIVSGIRTQYEMGNISTWVSTRDVIQIAQMAHSIGDVQAASELVLVGRASPEDEEPIRSSINDQNWS